MDSCKKTIDCLLFSNKIINVGKGGNESFKVVGEEECVNNKDNILCNDTLNETNIIFSSQVTQTSQENTLNELENYVNNKFFETLKDMISKEVKNTVNDLTVSDNDAKTASCKMNDISNNPSDLKCVVEIQQDEIDYLRRQLAIINSQKEEYIKNYLIKCDNNNDQTGLIETLKNHNVHLKQELLSKDKIINMLLEDNKVCMNKRNSKENIDVTHPLSESSKIGQIDETHERSEFEDVRIKKKKWKREIVILGDSITKNIEKHKMKKEMKSNENIFIKSFPGAVISDMYDYSRPSKKHSPDLFILHVGTNELRSSKTAEEISNELLKLASDLKTEQNEVLVSSIVNRDDKWNEKGIKVNAFLNTKKSELGLGFIDHSNISNNHLNGSGLHLNYHGTVALARNFLRAIHT